jgi:hypothetical protein
MANGSEWTIVPLRPLRPMTCAELGLNLEALLAGRALDRAARRVDELVEAVGLEGDAAQLPVEIVGAGSGRHLIVKHGEGGIDVGAHLLDLSDAFARVRQHEVAHLLGGERAHDGKDDHEHGEPQERAEQALMGSGDEDFEEVLHEASADQ